jgi:hypothetical protein
VKRRYFKGFSVLNVLTFPQNLIFLDLAQTYPDESNKIIMWTLSAFSDEAGASCDEQITAAKRARLSRIDIRTIDGFNITLLPFENAKTIKNKMDDAEVSVQMFGSPIGKIDILDDVEIDVKNPRHLGTLAPVLGCNAIRIFSYYNRTKISHAEWREKSLTNPTRLRDEAEKLNLVLYHEGGWVDGCGCG